MKPTEELVHEHQVIIHVLKTATAEAKGIRDGSAIRTALIEMMLDFFRNFTDKCHHAKEEKNLFPMLENKGMAHNTGPIAVMLSEHTEGRRLFSRIGGLLPAAKQGDQGAIIVIAEDLSAYANLLENDIAKENNVCLRYNPLPTPSPTFLALKFTLTVFVNPVI